VVLVLPVLDVINTSNNNNKGVLLGKVIILHELPPRLLEEKQEDTIVPDGPIIKVDHVNPTLPKQSYVQPLKDNTPHHHHHLYQN
jgi:hypothetical protein